MLCLLSMTLPLPALAAMSPLFGTAELESTDLTPFPKWTEVLQRFGEGRSGWPPCTGDACPAAVWARIGADIARQPVSLATLAQVNSFFNAVPYVQDDQNWGVNDYWATPQQFLTRNGDCEDYAIAKYLALRMAGWPRENMRIVVLQDNNLNLLHSILVVTIDGANYVLDNQIMQLVPDRTILHYQPIYSINENGWWRHVPR